MSQSFVSSIKKSKIPTLVKDIKVAGISLVFAWFFEE
jgi:hypothetical protein